MRLQLRRRRWPGPSRPSAALALALLAALVLAGAPRAAAAATPLPQVALLPMFRGPGVGDDEARQLQQWLATLLALRDDIVLVGLERLERGGGASRISAIAAAVAEAPLAADSATLLAGVLRLLPADRLLLARLQIAPSGRRLTLLCSEDGTLRRVIAVELPAGLDAGRKALRGAVDRWVRGRGEPERDGSPAVAVLAAPADAAPPATGAAQPPSAAISPTAGAPATDPASSSAAPPPARADAPGAAAPSLGGAGAVDAALASPPRDGPPAPMGVSGDARTNVYADNDGNRIVTPSVNVDAEVSESLRVSAHAALDVMTCASVDVRTAATPKGYFQETRQEVGGALTVSRELAKASVSVSGSRENDYGSLSVAVAWSDEFAQRNTTLALSYAFTDSDVGRANDPGFDRDLDSHALSATMTQVLSRRWIAQASAWLGVLDGFQSSVYRYVRFANGASGAERVPDLRVREAGVLQVRGALPADTFIAGSYRLYGDSWGILAHSAEVEASWLPAPSLALRLRDRVHIQRGSPYYQSRFGRPMSFMSIDRELGSLWGHLVGGKLSWQPGASFGTRKLEFDVKVDAMWQFFEDFPWLPERRWLVAEVGVSGSF